MYVCGTNIIGFFLNTKFIHLDNLNCNQLFYKYIIILFNKNTTNNIIYFLKHFNI